MAATDTRSHSEAEAAVQLRMGPSCSERSPLKGWNVLGTGGGFAEPDVGKVPTPSHEEPSVSLLWPDMLGWGLWEEPRGARSLAPAAATSALLGFHRPRGHQWPGSPWHAAPWPGRNAVGSARGRTPLSSAQTASGGFHLTETSLPPLSGYAKARGWPTQVTGRGAGQTGGQTGDRTDCQGPGWTWPRDLPL